MITFHVAYSKSEEAVCPDIVPHVAARVSCPPPEVAHFSPGRMSEKVLFHLLRHPSVNQEVPFDPNNRLSAAHYLYTRNHPVDYFILLLQVSEPLRASEARCSSVPQSGRKKTWSAVT